MKVFTTLLLACMSITGLYAQETGPDGTPLKPERKVSVQLQAGTQGLGLGARYAFIPQLAVRAGFGIIPIKMKSVYDFSVFSANYEVSSRFLNTHLLAEYTPFKNGRGFRLVAGGAYFLDGYGKVVGSPNGQYYYGEIPINNEQVGSLTATVDWKGMAPYFGIGLWRGIPDRRIGVNMDLGSYYLPEPKVSIEASGMLEGNETQQEQLQENLKDYRWMPVIQVNLNVKI